MTLLEAVRTPIEFEIIKHQQVREDEIETEIQDRINALTTYELLTLISDEIENLLENINA